MFLTNKGIFRRKNTKKKKWVEGVCINFGGIYMYLVISKNRRIERPRFTDQQRKRKAHVFLNFYS